MRSQYPVVVRSAWEEGDEVVDGVCNKSESYWLASGRCPHPPLPSIEFVRHDVPDESTKELLPANGATSLEVSSLHSTHFVKLLWSGDEQLCREEFTSPAYQVDLVGDVSSERLLFGVPFVSGAPADEWRGESGSHFARVGGCGVGKLIIPVLLGCLLSRAVCHCDSPV